MRLYHSPEKWQEKLLSISAPLRKKELAKLDGLYKSKGFIGQGGGTDSNGDFINVKLRPGMTPGDIAEFMEQNHFAAATIEARDMTALLGNSPISLGAQRGLELEGTAGTGYFPATELLEPSEVAEAIKAVAWRAFSNSAPTDAATEAVVAADLVAHGLMDASLAKGTDDWINVDTNKQAAIDHENLNGEWAVDNSYAEEWG